MIKVDQYYTALGPWDYLDQPPFGSFGLGVVIESDVNRFSTGDFITYISATNYRAIALVDELVSFKVPGAVPECLLSPLAYMIWMFDESLDLVQKDMFNFNELLESYVEIKGWQKRLAEIDKGFVKPKYIKSCIWDEAVNLMHILPKPLIISIKDLPKYKTSQDYTIIDYKL